MYYEKLALEVGATVAGLTVVKPPVLTGASGVEQKFSFVATDGSQTYCFDLCSEVGQVEILKTYIKKMDTGSRGFIVCLSGSPTPEAKEMAKSYGIEVLSPSDVGEFFSGRIMQQIRASASARPASR